MHRHRVALIVILGLGGGALLASCSGKDESNETGLGSRKIQVGEVEIVVELRRLDDTAEFDITLDTHSGSLDADLELSSLSVDGTDWAEPTWEGDGSGGHHREGILRFGAAGPPNGDVRLSLAGFGESVVLTWAR